MIPLLWYLTVPEKGHHKCDHCGKFDHKIDWCYALRGCPPRSAAVAHTDPLSEPSSANPHSSVFATDKSALFNEFLKWSEDRKLSSSMTFVAHTSTSFASLTQSLSFGPWCSTQVPPITLLVTNLCFPLCPLQIIYPLLEWLMGLVF